jgi:cell division protein FtsW (lipid II flippase)
VIGFLCLYSAAGGNIDPWASAQIIRFLFALVLLIGVAVIDLRWIFRAAYPFYALTLLLLVLVDVFGHIGMGAQRWLDIGIMKIQPSELAKIATVMALARYFHTKDMDQVRRLKTLLIPVAITNRCRRSRAGCHSLRRRTLPPHQHAIRAGHLSTIVFFQQAPRIASATAETGEL